MSNLASRLQEPSLRIEAPIGPIPWLPPEAPLSMPRQEPEDESALVQTQPATSPADMLSRRIAVFGGAFIMTALVAMGPAVLFAREGWDKLEIAAFAVFLPLVLAVACWFCSAVAGLSVLLGGREQEDLEFPARPSPPKTRTALLMPLYNEDAGAAFARLAAMDSSLARLGVSDAFDIFVLSDSTKDAVALEEQSAFRAFRVTAHSHIFYRRRIENTERKAGNIAEWVRRFGGAYDFMIVLDADSIMAGETVLRLVNAMEAHPRVGLIQTAPTITGASTLFARMQQFGVRMYGRVAAAGLAWWAGAEASYWGHNAIVRVHAFASAAGLPILPGVKPFGGHVLSHDVVEAALLRRAGWAVHVTAALDGSCEETPPTMLDFMQRDHRWCQGNLQHLKLLRAKGLHPISRLQLAMGCMAYISSPLWFAALVIGMAIQLQHPVDWSTFWYFLNPQFTPFMLTSLLSGALLIGPKVMGCILVMSRPRERREFGGARTILKGLGMEIFLSAALAPVLMVANTKSVLQTLRGRDVGWKPQQRDADGVSRADAYRAMGWQLFTGLSFVVALCFRPDLSVCFAPIVLPLLFAPQLAVWTSRRSHGEAFARGGFLVTPDDPGVSAIPAVLGARQTLAFAAPLHIEARPTVASAAAL